VHRVARTRAWASTPDASAHESRERRAVFAVSDAAIVAVTAAAEPPPGAESDPSWSQSSASDESRKEGGFAML
jgi:hypothetical protein